MKVLTGNTLASEWIDDKTYGSDHLPVVVDITLSSISNKDKYYSRQPI